ncbi:hypothetical protein ALC57_12457 [Trachymyrmex cornetzi]|uniref:Uncharacterized protein n=1 Tax=Trachymyrmex cornetzi TaxID=471704 RepID=A0A195DRB3_9HYME|nr:hypothetical protein ALC57_12457 [Trachymyrmex cornetzi]
MTRVTLDHLIGWFEASVCDLRNGELLMISLLGRNNGRVRHQREVDSRIGHQVGLEFR